MPGQTGQNTMYKTCKLAALALMIGACVTPEVLEPRIGIVPNDVDLSGYWHIRADGHRSQSRIRAAIRKTDGVKDDELFKRSNRPTSSQSHRSRDSKVKGGLVFVFLELGERLKVTQTAGGLFISFDRSIVEEFRFGEDRMISVGEIEAQRVTGWEGDTLVVDTLDRNGMKLTERFRLLQNDQVMERTIILRSKKQDSESIVQLFDRAVEQ